MSNEQIKGMHVTKHDMFVMILGLTSFSNVKENTVGTDIAIMKLENYLMKAFISSDTLNKIITLGEDQLWLLEYLHKAIEHTKAEVNNAKFREQKMLLEASANLLQEYANLHT